ncbi:hypothetical protein [Fredinandcohnia quinoae]|uniref:Lipoprotein n=1 Tax=Fredinandcohnia quinoae TaxID=2918902 RepID=A0AAW5ECH2_9BACI|nr:hypothetical protein [Fredinandcohnia sp. SECRCQ15]MCH1627146.1 hypothetical protein [Fredinandcohnia sp. SECRCQ15]
MKKERLVISLIVLLLITSGCMSEANKQKITIQKRKGEENIFEDYKEVTQNKQVQKAIEIVKNANWENTKVEMTRFADYQFQFPYKNTKEAKITSYLLWVSPNSKNLEIVTDSDKYIQLTIKDSANLYEILTGDSLGK